MNGRCELWVRTCVDGSAACGGDVASVAVDDAAADPELTSLVRLPASREQCGAVTTLTVALGARRNGSPRQARKRLAWRATAAADGTVDADAVVFVCKPPVKEKRRGAISFPAIQSRILEKSCAFSGCHGVDEPQAGLALAGDGVYEALVGALATPPPARFAGKQRVVPGAPETSFLMEKLERKLGPGEGSRMPRDRRPLADAQMEALRKWILAGAPKTRVVASGFAGELDRQPRIPAPDPPPGGFQVHMTPFLLGDAPEIEGCQMVRLGNPEDFDVGRWEVFMHEGSHHFILRAYPCSDADHDGTDDCDAPDSDARFPSGFAPCEQFGYAWSYLVATQTPHHVADYQTAETGVAVHLRRNPPLLLNAHYTNPFADTQAEVRVNATPVDPASMRHPARVLFEYVAQAFLEVPPGGESRAASHLACAFYADPATGEPDPRCVAAGEPSPTADRFALLGLGSHMHKRGDKFVVDLRDAGGAPVERADDMTDPDDGTRHLYVSDDWHDPLGRVFWPPLVVERGATLAYTCSHENGVRSPVRLGCEETPGVPPGEPLAAAVAEGRARGASRWCRSDADCAGFGTGRCVPANLVFGELAEDDMCIMPGLYYDCPASGPCFPGDPAAPLTAGR